MISALQNKATTVVNNIQNAHNIQNNHLGLEPLNPKELRKAFKNLEHCHLEQKCVKRCDPSGISGFIQEQRLLDNKVFISDLARMIFRFVLPDNTPVVDPQGHKISQHLFQSLRKRANELIEEKLNELSQLKETDKPYYSPDDIKQMCGNYRTLQGAIEKIAEGHIGKNYVRGKFVKDLVKIVETREERQNRIESDQSKMIQDVTVSDDGDTE